MSDLDIDATRRRLRAYADASADEAYIPTVSGLENFAHVLIADLWTATAELARLRAERDELLDALEDMAATWLGVGDGHIDHARMGSAEGVCDLLVQHRPGKWEHTSTGIVARTAGSDDREPAP